MSNEEDSSYAELLRRSDGTIEGAIYLWLAAQGKPILYNPFQNMYFTMTRDPRLTEEGRVEGETRGDRQARMNEIYDRLQTELYGDDHRVLAAEAQRREATEAQKEAAGGQRKRTVGKATS